MSAGDAHDLPMPPHNLLHQPAAMQTGRIHPLHAGPKRRVMHENQRGRIRPRAQRIVEPSQRRTKLSLCRRCRCPSFNELFISRARHESLVAQGSYAVPPPNDLAEAQAGAAVFSRACGVSPARRFSLSLKLSPLILMVLE